MSRRSVGSSVPSCSFPRVSGDEPLTASLIHGVRQFSPRERG